ncbi:MAG: CBS domain-containing protein [Kangiellaceae bacterium]|jgi:CBS domain-containing membrane protein
MSQISEIMTPNPICLSEHANVHKARMLMAEKSIRHIPIIEPESKKLIGMLNQKAVLSNAIKIINQRGLDNLEHEEKAIEVASIMQRDASSIEIGQSLLEVANTLLEQKSGCVVICEQSKVIGVISSKDFVKLAARELAQ